MIEILLIIGAIVLALIIVGLSWWMGTYNRLASGVQNIETQWSNVKAEYQRRADLLYNLVESVKSYANFERTTLREVIQARGGNFGKSTPEQMKKIQKLDGTFGSLMSRLMVVFERYPKLKASELYQNLIEETSMTENRVNVARTDFNEVVREYNTLIVTFPSKLIATKYNFKVWKFFEVDDKSVEKAPKFKFDKIE